MSIAEDEAEKVYPTGFMADDLEKAAKDAK